MFTTIFGSAVMLLPSLSEIPREALIPSITDGSIIRIFSIVGGIGGTLALAAYGYWIRAKGWKTKDMVPTMRDRKSTRLNSSHVAISYAVFCLKKKKKNTKKLN